MVPKIGVFLACLASICFMSCNKGPSKGGPAKCPWLYLTYTSNNHTIQLEVGGKPFASFEKKGGGFQSKPTPLEEGTNSLVVTFIPRKEHSMSQSELGIGLSSKMIPDKWVPGVKCDADPETYCEYQIQIDINNGQPGAIRYTRRDWTDEQRKHLVWEERVETTPSESQKEFDKAWYNKWTEDGKKVLETAEEKDKLVTGKFFKPDGTIGAEIKDGTGVKKEWHENGRVATITPYSKGYMHGEHLVYDEEGKVRVRGTYSQGEKDGTWIRNDAAGKKVEESTFEKGNLVKGSDKFEDD